MPCDRAQCWGDDAITVAWQWGVSWAMQRMAEAVDDARAVPLAPPAVPRDERIAARIADMAAKAVPMRPGGDWPDVVTVRPGVAERMARGEATAGDRDDG
jgi:hypothetical protein